MSFAVHNSLNGQSLPIQTFPNKNGQKKHASLKAMMIIWSATEEYPNHKPLRGNKAIFFPFQNFLLNYRWKSKSIFLLFYQCTMIFQIPRLSLAKGAILFPLLLQSHINPENTWTIYHKGSVGYLTPFLQILPVEGECQVHSCISP